MQRKTVSHKPTVYIYQSDSLIYVAVLATISCKMDQTVCRTQERILCNIKCVTVSEVHVGRCVGWGWYNTAAGISRFRHNQNRL